MRLIINADDFGLTPAVTYGIYNCIKKGIVTSTTFMVNQEATELASSIIKSDDDLAVGLHLNISLGKPLTKCPSLLRNDMFIKPKNLISDDIYDENELYKEIEAQYDKFVSLTGKKPTHLDSHLYTHQRLKKMRDAVIKLSQQKDVPIRELSNGLYEEVSFEGNFKVLPGETIQDLQNKFTTLIKSNKNKEIMELMVHPAFIDEDLVEISSYSSNRMIESDILLNNHNKEYLKENNIELISFKDVKKKRI